MPRKINESMVSYRKHQTRLALEEERVDGNLVELVATINRLKNCGVVTSECGGLTDHVCRVSFIWTIDAAVAYGSVMIEKIIRMYENERLPMGKWPQIVTHYDHVTPDGSVGPIRSLCINWESDWDLKFFCNMIIDLIEREYKDFLDWE